MSTDNLIVRQRKGRETQARQREIDERTPIQLQVNDNDHARSGEVIEFCLTFLANGGRWGQLRRALGLENAGIDRRWRIVREVVTDTMIPKDNQEALLLHIRSSLFLNEKLHEQLADLEGVLEHLPDTEEDRKLLPNLMKVKLDTIKGLLEENQKKFDNYAELEKIKSQDKKTQGTSVIIQHNYHINRPGDTPREIAEVTKKSADLLSKGQKVINGRG